MTDPDVFTCAAAMPPATCAHGLGDYWAELRARGLPGPHWTRKTVAPPGGPRRRESDLVHDLGIERAEGVE
ncbi:hypothetical protein AB0K60_26275 [Thermopolyspora sp. NPDC052614]|uniref:hypothetical protein n=1 Tax=Thermopolyspora sp. NPDC052614 TaxID=3155682 RepID=UPI003416AE46